MTNGERIGVTGTGERHGDERMISMSPSLFLVNFVFFTFSPL